MNLASIISLWRRAGIALAVAFVLLIPTGANADTRLIVRTTSISTLKFVCSLVGCNVTRNIDGATNQLFLVTTPDIGLNNSVKLVLGIPGVVSPAPA